MKRLHEIVRRRVCQVTFLVVCLVPTAVVLGWGIARALPGHAAAHAQQLRDELGLRVTIGGVSYPRPGAVLYHGLELLDPETGRSILRCRLLEAGTDEGAFTMRASQAEVEAEQADRLWQVLLRRLRQERIDSTPEIRLLASEVTWHGPRSASAQPSQTFADVSGWLKAVSEGHEAGLNFRVAGTNMPELATLRVVRNRKTAQPITTVWLDTDGIPLPCSVFAPLVDGHGWLGPRGKFRGSLRAIDSLDNWEAEITGQLSDIDLDTLVGHFPHKLTGDANLQLERARFVAGRLIEATGNLTAGPGVIGRSLVSAGIQNLKLARDSDSVTTSAMLKYERLACDFLINSAGLHLEGRCQSDTRGALLVDFDRHAVWVEPDGPQPIVALLRMLVPQSEVQAPVTRETDWLMRHLPIPEIVPPRSSSGINLPQAQLRGVSALR